MWDRRQPWKICARYALLLACSPVGRLGAQSSATTVIDSASRAAVVAAATRTLDSVYVFPDVAARMGAALRDQMNRRTYDTVATDETFAALLTQHLRAVSNDRHLRVIWFPQGAPVRLGAPLPDENMRRRLEAVNCGFESTRMLSGNVGYLKLNTFGHPEICAPVATRELQGLVDADALIVDLRQNGGGEPDMLTHVLSYFFAERTHLLDFESRRASLARQFWTDSTAPGRKLRRSAPVYVLTSARTFSAAEAFSYIIQSTKRGVVVGETTAGGAHSATWYRIGSHFILVAPDARAVSRITGTNWEGKGVEPDVKTSADDALDAAHRLATDRMQRGA